MKQNMNSKAVGPVNATCWIKSNTASYHAKLRSPEFISDWDKCSKSLVSLSI